MEQQRRENDQKRIEARAASGVRLERSIKLNDKFGGITDWNAGTT